MATVKASTYLVSAEFVPILRYDDEEDQVKYLKEDLAAGGLKKVKVVKKG